MSSEDGPEGSGANPWDSAKSSDKVRQFTVGPDDDDIRVDRWFKRNLPQIGFAMVSRWARTGQVRVDGKRTKPEARLRAGQVLRVPPGGESTQRKPRKREELSDDDIDRAEAMLITQDKAAIVLNKPPGLATQGGTGTRDHVDRLLDAFAGESDPRPRLVHRLDKDTSGVLLTARSPGSAAFFSKRFSGRDAKKVYWALVVGVPEVHDGVIEAKLSKQPGTGGEKMHVDEQGGQTAKTRYRVVDRAGNRAAWVELQPFTGRTHQLRVHMAAIGHPIVGDGKYGGQDAFLTGSISRKMHLHARRLIIEHPDGVPLDVTAGLPEHFAQSMEQLGFDEADSDAAPEQDRGPMPKDLQKKAARQHSKQIRKEQRGERKGRGTKDAPKRKLGKKSKAQFAKPGGKPGGGPNKRGKR
ncbi:RluA family pseudouridine synthase [Pontixanthobacter aestiaquae]|uniref:RNA pseudouridine synthase n=1 Tax=Pontixanthobacter aestiaquae TaxID=1509367 RepID=A0A844Z4Q7_9SPHN|nr:RluA family pseudouridine synthase [Pontixanthobacter aestiaquae]MDN3646103.1 RluA family pseudouridine synthase [Pontixanthobacter aestiaquae]MXO82905.1 RNA pseudouridine synthase [Pontixanthobacter aestiaquae]